MKDKKKEGRFVEEGREEGRKEGYHGRKEGRGRKAGRKRGKEDLALALQVHHVRLPPLFVRMSELKKGRRRK
jgi:hypothetical protein